VYTAPQAPQSIGGVIDNAIELFKASFRSCWVAALVYAIVLGAIAIWMQLGFVSTIGGGRPNPAALLAIYQSPNFLFGYLLIMLASIAFTLMLNCAILDVARGGAGANPMSYLGTVVAWVPGAVVASLVLAIACAVGLVLLIVPGLYLAFRWILWTVALCDERRGAFAGLGTSWRLIGGNWWRTVIVLSVATLIVILITLVFGFVGGLVGGIMSADLTTRLIVSQVLNALGQVLYLPAIISTMVAIYLDLKLRKDGADLEARLGSIGTQQA